jgi:hypothetical protein
MLNKIKELNNMINPKLTIKDLNEILDGLYAQRDLLTSEEALKNNMQTIKKIYFLLTSYDEVAA